MALYGCTITSDESFLLGNTEYVYINFFGYLSHNLSNIYDPNPEPVPPAIEWHNMKPSNESLPSASLSIISVISSTFSSPNS